MIGRLSLSGGGQIGGWSDMAGGYMQALIASETDNFSSRAGFSYTILYREAEPGLFGLIAWLPDLM